VVRNHGISGEGWYQTRFSGEESLVLKRGLREWEDLRKGTLAVSVNGGERLGGKGNQSLGVSRRSLCPRVGDYVTGAGTAHVTEGVTLRKEKRKGGGTRFAGQEKGNDPNCRTRHRKGTLKREIPYETCTKGPPQKGGKKFYLLALTTRKGEAWGKAGSTRLTRRKGGRGREAAMTW